MRPLHVTESLSNKFFFFVYDKAAAENRTHIHQLHMAFGL